MASGICTGSITARTAKTPATKAGDEGIVLLGKRV
jgi:hypothetical protein